MSTTEECSLWASRDQSAGAEVNSSGSSSAALRYTKIVDTFQKSRRGRKIPIALRAPHYPRLHSAFLRGACLRRRRSKAGRKVEVGESKIQEIPSRKSLPAPPSSGRTATSVNRGRTGTTLGILEIICTQSVKVVPRGRESERENRNNFLARVLWCVCSAA